MASPSLLWTPCYLLHDNLQWHLVQCEVAKCDAALSELLRTELTYLLCKKVISKKGTLRPFWGKRTGRNGNRYLHLNENGIKTLKQWGCAWERELTDGSGREWEYEFISTSPLVHGQSQRRSLWCHGHKICCGITPIIYRPVADPGGVGWGRDPAMSASCLFTGLSKSQTGNEYCTGWSANREDY